MRVIHLLRKPCSETTVAANTLRHGAGGLNIGATRIPFVSKADEDESKTKNQHGTFGSKPLTGNVIYGDYSMIRPHNYTAPGRWPANFILQHLDGCGEACVEGCALPKLDAQSGTCVSSGGRIGNAEGVFAHQGSTGFGTDHVRGNPGYGDVGGASRYFKRVRS